MRFIGPSDEARFNRQLVQFAEVAEPSIEVSRRLIKSGLYLLEARYGGVLQHAEDVLNPTFERFEIELLKERYGSWTVFRDGVLTWFGYRSSFLERMLQDAGITRDELEDLSRSEEVDSRIDAQPWAWRYRREVLYAWRSEAHRKNVSEEKHREFQALGLTHAEEALKVREHIERFVAEQLGSLGYERTTKKYDKFKTVYTNAKRVGNGMAFEFAPDIDVTPITGLPASLNLYLMPVCDTSGADDFFVSCLQRGNFFKLAGPLVPNFGVYRAAWDMKQLELMLHAYRTFLAEFVPLAENTCAQSTAA